MSKSLHIWKRVLALSGAEFGTLTARQLEDLLLRMTRTDHLALKVWIRHRRAWTRHDAPLSAQEKTHGQRARPWVRKH